MNRYFFEEKIMQIVLDSNLNSRVVNVKVKIIGLNLRD